METPYSVIRLEVASSTQDVARSSFVDRPVLVVADRQDVGRGRSGTTWLNADRAVALSFAFVPEWSQSDWGRIPLVAGLAVARAVGASLKWPNDVLQQGQKVGGILVEAASNGPVVVGVGLNLWWEAPPAGMAGIHAQDPGDRAAERVATDFARELIDILDRPVDRWPRNEYVSRCVTIGRDITWEPNGTGTAIDIDDDGALIVATSSGRRSLHSGEVRHIR